MALILYRKCAHAQSEQGTAKQCREFGGERKGVHGAECLRGSAANRSALPLRESYGMARRQRSANLAT